MAELSKPGWSARAQFGRDVTSERLRERHGLSAGTAPHGGKNGCLGLFQIQYEGEYLLFFAGRLGQAGPTEVIILTMPTVNSPTDRLAELRRAYLFTDMGPAHLQTLVNGMQDLRLKAGDNLFRHGQPAERFFFLREGLIKLYRLSPDGDEKIIEIMRPGETFAEAVMFMGNAGRYPVNAEAVSEARLYTFDQKIFLKLLSESNEACFGLLASMSRRLHMLV
ncbi:MAG TPA: Crp/Fnr family transcriptional regulator, partial [Burkholderiales bacterium]|nr:Crp/Fnr family transcriptional regulator [Burkholderiales bacterium]